MRHEKEPAIRYAQCGFVGMGAVKRVMFQQVCCVFLNSQKRRRLTPVEKQCKTMVNM